MYKIIRKEQLSGNNSLLEVRAELVANKAKAGQFVIIRPDEIGERIPISLAGIHPEKGTLTMVIQKVGVTSAKVCAKGEGEYLHDLVGPLGKPTHIDKFGNVFLVGGGIGIAPLYPVAKAMKEASNKVNIIIGARDESLLIYEKELAEVSDGVFITTDNGSKGRKGFVTDELKAHIEAGEKIELVIAIGPVIMMRAVSELTKPHGIKTIVSLNPIMVDGTGMCGACRVTVGGKVNFACVDGPEFDAHLVDFDELILRNQYYLEEERYSYDLFKRHHSGGCC